MPDTGLLHQLIDQRQVLETQGQTEGWVVMAGKYRGHVVLHYKALGGPPFHGSPPDVRLQPGDLGRHHGFTDGRGVHQPELVVDQLGDVAIAIQTHTPDVAHRAEYRRHVVHCGIGPADKQDHVAPYG